LGFGLWATPVFLLTHGSERIYLWRYINLSGYIRRGLGDLQGTSTTKLDGSKLVQFGAGVAQPVSMTSRILIFAAIVACGSAVAFAAGDEQKSNATSVKLEKDKDKDKPKDSVPISVPDGDPSTALLLTVGAGTAIVWAMARARFAKRT
jgi:hypothetical protein